MNSLHRSNGFAPAAAIFACLATISLHGVSRAQLGPAVSSSGADRSPRDSARSVTLPVRAGASHSLVPFDGGGTDAAGGDGFPRCLPGYHPGCDRWVELPPPARAHHAAVYDEQHRRLIVFGGRCSYSGACNDVWILSLRGQPRWERAQPLGSPPSPRLGPAVALDPARGRMVLIGGCEATGRFLDDAWELSLAGRPRWRRLAPAGAAPAGRFLATLTLDPKHDRMLLFGGWSGKEYHGDLWQLTLAGRMSWSELKPPTEAPGCRANHSAVYVPELRGILVFGGAGGDCCINPCPFCHQRQDLWLLSTNDEPYWADLTARTSGTPPCPVQGHRAVYDLRHERMLVIGGDALFNSCEGLRADVWSLSTRDLRWSKLDIAGATPRARVHATAVLDPVEDRLIVYGGEDDIYGGNVFADAWEMPLEGAPRWSRISPREAGPTARWGAPAVYDPDQDRVVAYQAGEVWSYSFRDGTGWERLAPAGTAPPPRCQHVVVYDSRRDRMIVYGGSSDVVQGQRDYFDTWALSLGERPTWSQITTRGQPLASTLAAAIYDPVRDRVILYGGDGPWPDANRAWSLSLEDAPEWTTLVGGGWTPPPRTALCAIYDSKRDRMLVHGGGFAAGDGWNVWGDTWELPLGEPPAWHEVGTAGDRPPCKAFHAGVFDPVGDRLVVVGGWFVGAPGGPLPDAYELDFTDPPHWRRLEPAGSPAPAWGMVSGVYVAGRRRMVLFEGDHLWALELGKGRVQSWRREVALRPAEGAPGQPPHAGPTLALRGVEPNPSSGAFTATLSLPDAFPAGLELLDLAGRRVWSLDVGALGPGTHRVRIATDRRLASGIYLLRLTHGSTPLTRKVVRIE